MAPKFSLVVCTIGRPADVERLFASLAAQTYHNFEVILVDQSGDDRIEAVLRARTFSFPIRHLRSARGLSLGRNLGLAHAGGEIIAFPDDDCAYPAGTLAQVYERFSRTTTPDGVGGRSFDFDGRPSGPRAPATASRITKDNIWRCAISYTIFLRHRVIEAVGRFDEELGVGAGTPFQSGEETDYLLRALAHGFTLAYAPDLVVHHPVGNVPDGPAQAAKDLGYAIGMGRVVRKNGLGLAYFLPHLGKPIARSVYAFTTCDWPAARRYLNRARGRWKGFLWPLPSANS